MAGAGGGDLRDGVNVPYELLQWSQSDDAKAVAEKIRGKTDATAIDLVSARPGKASFQISAASADCLRAARSLLETHLSFQIEYQQRKQQTEKMEEDLRATNAEFETGQRVEFSVPENLIGLVIGKGGARVTKVKEDTGVERIIVDARTRVVRIRGRDPEAVRRARDMLEYEEIALPLQPGQPRTIIGERGRNIAEIMRKSGCVNIMVEKDRFLRIVGTKKAVQLAQDLVETQLEYEQKMSSLRVNEANIQRQLSAIDANYRDFAGHNGPRPRQQQRRDGFLSSADDASHRSRGSGSSSVKVTELATTIKNNTNNNKTKMEHQHGSKNNNVANNKAPKAGTSAAARGAGQPQPPKQAQSQQPVRDDATTATKDKVVQPARANPSSSNNNKKKKKAVAAAVATTAAAAANPSSDKAAADATGEASKSSSPSEEVPAPVAPVLEKQQERGQPTGPSTKPKRNNNKAKGSNKQKPVTSSVKDAPAENVGPNKATEQPNTLRSQQPSKKQAPKQKAPSAAVTKETIPSADPGPKQEEKTKA
ncbi:Fragile X mental retardation syndrome-related protein 1 [Hondaea fermentalgiana]|uniref:Fragile X mental retardation syndrome-related protein 1 n=1 Tax=Hondaea fermentalgiana TaxID=2315210 RepID=A0A2R5G019_9STRA|nr:Fragile X mental retardation syndrome-related protein 1 [Hondaea fermentalgiana]|eukprot:GBG23865.1 Fragile X mental retardation syndrome-related protein 1 [Hondaea fermentalgiana]